MYDYRKMLITYMAHVIDVESDDFVDTERTYYGPTLSALGLTEDEHEELRRISVIATELVDSVPSSAKSVHVGEASPPWERRAWLTRIEPNTQSAPESNKP